MLPEAAVFEDLAPRLVRLAADEPPQLLTIVSHRAHGARLALVRAGAGALVLGARSPAIGAPMRWLNPVGVADLDGDERAEIAPGEVAVGLQTGRRLVVLRECRG